MVGEVSNTISPLFSWRSTIIDSDLPPTAKLVALCLSMHMSERGDSCYPSISTQCEETGLSRSTVCGHLKLLEEQAYLRRETGLKGKSTRYVATFPIAVVAGQAGSAMSELASPLVVPEVVKEHAIEDQDLSAGKQPSKRERKPDPVWDALEAVTHFTPTTKGETSDFAKTVHEIRAVIPKDATREQIQQAMEARRAAFHHLHDGATFTHRVLRQRWGELGVHARGSTLIRMHSPLPELPEGETF